MSDPLTILIKAVAGGGLVVAFAAIAEGLRPKRFAGLFSAAPAVAVASLVVTLATKGAHDAREATIGMVAGCAGMIAYAIAVVPLLRRLDALAASGAALVVWFVVAAALAAPLL